MPKDTTRNKAIQAMNKAAKLSDIDKLRQVAEPEPGQLRGMDGVYTWNRSEDKAKRQYFTVTCLRCGWVADILNSNSLHMSCECKTNPVEIWQGDSVVIQCGKYEEEFA